MKVFMTEIIDNILTQIEGFAKLISQNIIAIIAVLILLLPSFVSVLGIQIQDPKVYFYILCYSSVLAFLINVIITKNTQKFKDLESLPKKFEDQIDRMKEISKHNKVEIDFDHYKGIIVDISNNYCHGNKMTIFGVNFERFGYDPDRRDLLDFLRKKGNSVDIICTEYPLSNKDNIDTYIDDFLTQVKDEENISETLKKIKLYVINKNNLKAKITVFDTTNAYYQLPWNFRDDETSEYGYKDLGINIMDKKVVFRIRTDISKEIKKGTEIDLVELLIKKNKEV